MRRHQFERNELCLKGLRCGLQMSVVRICGLSLRAWWPTEPNPGDDSTITLLTVSTMALRRGCALI